MACGVGIGKGKGSGSKGGRWKFGFKCWVGGMGEGAKEELGGVGGHEASRVSGFVAIWMDVKGEGWVGQKGLTEGVI